jgi:hypothetical protein
MNVWQNSGNSRPWKTDLSDENLMAAAAGTDLAVENMVVVVVLPLRR